MKREQALQEIKNSWREILPQLTSPAKKKVNGEQSYICPLCDHGTHGDGLTYDPTSRDQNGLKCFGCEFSGDIIDLYRQTTGKDFNEALTDLAAMIRITIDQPNTRATATPQESEEHTTDYTEYIRNCSSKYIGSAGETYLQGRSISSGTAAAHGIGYDPEARRVIFPCGNSYAARSIDPAAERKYLNSKGQMYLFNAAAISSNAKVIYICEGAMDALSIIEMGGTAIGLNGKGNGSKLLDLLQKEPTQAAFIICHDNERDKDGNPDTKKQETTLRQANELNADLHKMNLQSIVYNVAGDQHDLNEALQADPAAFAERISAAEKELFKDDLDRFFEKVQTETYKPHRTGLNFFDELLAGGVINQSLLLLLAAPGAGKTTLCAQLAESMAAQQTPVIYINLEMSREQMIAKAISARLFRKGYHRNALQVLQGYKWTEQDKAAISREIDDYRKTNYPYIRYNPEGITSDLDDILNYLTEAGERAKAAGQAAPAVIVDYLHLISSKGSETQELIKRAVFGLKNYAVKYDTFVVSIIAANRAANKAGRYTLADGRDSSNIEYTADYQLSLNYYDLEKGEVSQDDPAAFAQLQQKPKREMILRVLKGRLITPGKESKILFNAEYNTFYGTTDENIDPAWLILDDDRTAFEEPIQTTIQRR